MSIDQQLLNACQKGDRKSQFRLYKASYGLLMSICIRYENNKDDADCLLNKGFMKILTSLDKYTPQASFLAWARRVMTNVAIDEFRRNKKYKQHIQHIDFSETQIEPETHNEAIDFPVKPKEIEKLIQELPPMSKQIFNLFVFDNYKHKEIAEIMNISEGTSKWHVSNARKLLKEKINLITSTPKIRML